MPTGSKLKHSRAWRFDKKVKVKYSTERLGAWVAIRCINNNKRAKESSWRVHRNEE